MAALVKRLSRGSAVLGRVGFQAQFSLSLKKYTVLGWGSNWSLRAYELPCCYLKLNVHMYIGMASLLTAASR